MAAYSRKSGLGGGEDQLRDRLFRLARLEALKVHGVQA